MTIFRQLISAAIVSLAVFTATAQSQKQVQAVRPGIETLRDSGFEQLRGKRVGLITNPTGVDSSLRATIDILAEAPEVKLVALFAPEHGVRGDILAGEKVTDTVDKATGIKVHSLYGATRRPTAAMLEDIDVLVYDIQDSGCRSYTFISTMGLAMEQCARLGKEFMVLDRPDPLGGYKVEGPLVDAGCVSFVSQYPIPYIYGLTPGELARMLVGEKIIKSDKPLRLTVVPMTGWHRDMLFADTGLPWVPTSPQLPSAETAIFYPATGIAGELDYVSIGVGYTLPFRTFAAPWVNGRELAQALNDRNIPGLAFRPVTYSPMFGADKGKHLEGVQIYVTDFDRAQLTMIQFHIMEALANLYPAHKASVGAKPARFAMFDKVVGTKELRPLFFKRHKVADILPLWNRDADSFAARKAKYHLYD